MKLRDLARFIGSLQRPAAFRTTKMRELAALASGAKLARGEPGATPAKYLVPKIAIETNLSGANLFELQKHQRSTTVERDADFSGTATAYYFSSRREGAKNLTIVSLTNGGARNLVSP